MSADTKILDRLKASRQSALDEIWRAKDALYEYARIGQMEKARDMAQRIYIYEKVFEELWPPEGPEREVKQTPSRHKMDY